MKIIPKHYLQVVLLGDSITWSANVPFGRRYGDFIEKDLQVRLGRNVLVDVAVCGDGGNTAGQALARLERDCLAYDPHLVLINLGANNILRAPQYLEPDFRALIGRIRRRRPAARIVLETIPTLDPERHAFRNQPEIVKNGGVAKVMADRYLAVIYRVAREYRLPLHDRFGIFQRALSKRPALNTSLICADGAHFTVAGNRYFARSAAGLLAEQICLPPAVSKRPAGAWLAMARQNPAFTYARQCLKDGGLTQFLGTSGSWSRLLFQQAWSFARRAACLTTSRKARQEALTMAALAVAFSALQRALPAETHLQPKGENLRWLRSQLRPYRQDRRVRMFMGLD